MVWLLALASPAGASDHPAGPEHLKVTAQTRPARGSVYVGQTIDLFLSVVAGKERPRPVAPQVAGADVTEAGAEQRPLAVSAIGDSVFNQSLCRFHYRIVPRRAGILTIPPVHVALGERTGATQVIRLDVVHPPDVGRTGDFLGGVGSFEVEARAEPSSLRVGQTLEYTITVRGPGARGISSAPRIERLQRLPIVPRVDRLTDRVDTDPPSHTFVYRLRPTRAGETTLPPVTVSGFDPASSHYESKVTPGVPIRVANVARLDPSAVAYGLVAADGATDDKPASERAIAFAAALLAAMLATFWLVVRPSERLAAQVHALTGQTTSRLTKADGHAEAGRVITESLIAYLGLTVSRPPGALTPTEAGQGIALATGSTDLALRARELVARSDCAQFAGETSGPADPTAPAPESVSAWDGSLASAGVGFFGDLGRVHVVATRTTEPSTRA
jgi:hypothetical protein